MRARGYSARSGVVGIVSEQLIDISKEACSRSTNTLALFTYIKQRYFIVEYLCNIGLFIKDTSLANPQLCDIYNQMHLDD